MVERRIIDLKKIDAQLQNDPKAVVELAEKRFRDRLVEVCALIEERRVALLAGPSCSGKTTTSLKLKEILESRGHEVYTVALDNFFVHRELLPVLENGKKDLESIDTINTELLECTLRSLISGKETPMPIYNFYTGKREDNSYTIKLEKDAVIIIEGLHALNERIISHLDFEVAKIYIDFSGNFYWGTHRALSWRDARFLRRMVRDSKFRGYPASETIKVWDEVLAGEDKYVIPFISAADEIIDTSFEYELGLIKPYALKIIEEILHNEEYGIYARQLRSALKYLTEVDEELVPANSLLREFIGGSAFADENGAK